MLKSPRKETPAQISVPKLLVKGKDKDVFRNAGIQMTSRELFPWEPLEDVHLQNEETTKEKTSTVVGIGGRTRPGQSDQMGAKVQKAPEMMAQRGEKTTNAFRHVGYLLMGTK